MFEDAAMEDWIMDQILEGDDWSESGENMDEDGESEFFPNPIGSCEAVNELLSNDMMRMSPGDRISVAEELHGVSCLAIEEKDDEVTTERVTKALYELDQILEYKIPANQKGAFLKAQSFEETRGTYVNDVGFKMKFLRCKLFNVEEAARLLVEYLELVQELYGDVCLSRPIRLEDVQSSKEERAAFRAGYIQLLPFGDRAGRRIAMITTDALDYSSLIRVKIFLYLWTVASNDVSTQQKGVILICWDGRKDKALPRPNEQQLIRKFFRAIPVRICGIHFCFPDTPFYRMARAIFTLTVGAVEHRNRLRFHVGEETELKYQVGTFGVPVSQIPITETGNVKRGSFQKWIGMRVISEEMEAQEAAARRQKRKELQFSRAQSQWPMSTQTKPQMTDFMAVDNKKKSHIVPTPQFVEYPNVNDVAFRKGVSLMHHSGNDYFHGLIQSKVLEHEGESQTGKSRISWWVVDEIRKRNGRFLSWDQRGWWYVLEDESKIRLRVAVSFREWKKHMKAEKNRQTMILKRKNTNKFRNLQHGIVEGSCSSSEDEFGEDHSNCSSFFGS